MASHKTTVRAHIVKHDDRVVVTFGEEVPLSEVGDIAESFDRQNSGSVVTRVGHTLTFRPRGPKNLTQKERTGFAKRTENSLTEGLSDVEIKSVKSLEELSTRKQLV